MVLARGPFHTGLNGDPCFQLSALDSHFGKEWLGRGVLKIFDHVLHVIQVHHYAFQTIQQRLALGGSLLLSRHLNGQADALGCSTRCSSVAATQRWQRSQQDKSGGFLHSGVHPLLMTFRRRGSKAETVSQTYPLLSAVILNLHDCPSALHPVMMPSTDFRL